MPDIVAVETVDDNVLVTVALPVADMLKADGTRKSKADRLKVIRDAMKEAAVEP